MRRDLPLGTQLAMVTHAAGESAALSAPTPGCHAVVLHARSEVELLRCAEAIRAAGWHAQLVHEPDAPWCGQAMALAVPPHAGAREALKHVFKKLQLAR